MGNHIFVLLQKLEGKAEQIRTLVVEHETKKLSAEINQRKQMELRIASQVEEMETLAAETLQLNETLKAVRKKHQGKKYGNISAYYTGCGRKNTPIWEGHSFGWGARRRTAVYVPFSVYTMVWLGEQRAFIVEEFIKNGRSPVATQCAFRIHFALC